LFPIRKPVIFSYQFARYFAKNPREGHEVSAINFRGDRMNKIKSLIAAAVLAGLGSSAFGAVVTATSFIPGISDFTIEFTDANSNGLLEWSEIDSFSGVSNLGTVFNTLNTVPTIAGISVFSTIFDFGQSQVNWAFREGPLQLSANHLWTYAIELDQGGGNPDLGVIPLPAALPMLVGALGIFGFLRRRQVKAA